MLKYAGLVLIISISSFSGMYFSTTLKSRVVVLKKINYLIDEIMILLRYKASTVYEIIECLIKNERFSDFSFLGNIGIDGATSFQLDWCNSLEANPPLNLKKDDLLILADIGRNLGTSDIEGQISTLKLQRNELEILISSAEADCERKSKLYRSLGVLVGAFISVMLI